MVGDAGLGMGMEGEKPLGQLKCLAQLVNELDAGIFKDSVARLLSAETVFVVHRVDKEGFGKAAKCFPDRHLKEGA